MPNPISEFLWSRMLVKGLKAGVSTFLATWGANLAGAGITVNEQALVAFLAGALTSLRNYLKIKRGWKWL